VVKSVSKKAPRKGGRPSRKQAENIRDEILDIATGLFFTQGYGATSIESVAQLARMSKRTFYHRFEDKADLFRAVVHRVIENLRPANVTGLFEGAAFEDILHRIARIVLDAALTPEALALHRLILAEAGRFPELALVVNREGARQEAVRRIAGLLQQEPSTRHLTPEYAVFAAEQFLQMVVALPQRRAMGLGKPMTRAELDAWARDAVELFLHGCVKPPAQ
jgi:AcrR family transcriptional regulator